MNEANKPVVVGGADAAKRTLPRHWKFASAALLAFGLIVGGSAADNREHEDRDIWFVHATDPHIFIPAAQGQVEQEKDAAATEQESEEKTTAEAKQQEPNEKTCLAREQKKRKDDALIAQTQEGLNETALSDMLERIRSLPEGDGPPAFLVFTGDLGIDPCDICKTASQPGPRTLAECLDADPANQIKETARILGKSPVPNIYLVAGNNDIANESADDAAIKYFNDFIDAVQAKLNADKKNVRLHNLTRCYASGEQPTACYADIDGTDYRLIGFPSYSFKKPGVGQEGKMKVFRDLVEKAKGKKVLIISHTPEMDDPYLLAESRYIKDRERKEKEKKDAEKKEPMEKGTETKKETETKTAAETNANTETYKPLSVSTWNVSKELLDDWKNVLALDSVVAVLAGHLHDSHKEIYRRPYPWSSVNEHRAAFHKLFLAPPLAVKKQDNSPIQARGFSLIHLRPDRVESRLFWYNSQTHDFAPDLRPEHRRDQHGFWQGPSQQLGATVMSLWNLDKADNAMVRMGVLLIAFLTAFLTIVAVWQIPAADDPFADKPKTAQGTADDKKTAQGTSNTAADSSPYSNRFGKTVIAGLGGLVATEVAKAVGNQQPSAETRWYYIVWFVLFFFLLLFSLNFLRAVAEAVRARIAVVYYPPAAPEHRRRLLRNWLVSLRVPLLTAFDTFINLIQGKNQTITRVFAERVVDQQRTVISVADKIRASLNDLIERRVRAHSKTSDVTNLVRVNISVLSADQSTIFYISRTAGSSHSSFPKNSVAWISVFTGEIRWYKSAYRKLHDYEKIVLFDNVIPGEKGSILLKDYYQVRQEDYKAFAIFPVPWPRRSFGGDFVKGAIHISFCDDSDFERIWKAEAMGEKGTSPNYSKSERMLDEWCDGEVRGVLRNSVAVMGELLRGFNEEIYRSYVEGKQPN